ncbi:hypothetical protein [Ralstonia insidiosa]|uniref:hypothetical protein n=1 Tax=Ralstonia insidiosa TaxID=190721 RepID=UPI0012E73CA6|nr:hypothetical protein [Ralstonia insidiosa]
MIGTRFNGVPISYSNAINPTGGFIDDLSRVFQQKLAENPSLSWELLVRASLGLIEGLSPELAKFILDLIVKTENESTAELKKKWEAENSYIDGRVTTHVTDYTRDILDNGRRVLLVAHSQGNLYANASHRLLYTNPEVTPGSFGTIGVASPANYVAGGGSTSPPMLMSLSTRCGPSSQTKFCQPMFRSRSIRQSSPDTTSSKLICISKNLPGKN